jgi:hypothetical protein
MKKEQIAEQIIDLVKSEGFDEGLSKLLIRMHNLIAHSVPPTDWIDSTQNDLFSFWKLIELIEQVEKDLRVENSK